MPLGYLFRLQSNCHDDRIYRHPCQWLFCCSPISHSWQLCRQSQIFDRRTQINGDWSTRHSDSMSVGRALHRLPANTSSLRITTESQTIATSAVKYHLSTPFKKLQPPKSPRFQQFSWIYIVVVVPNNRLHSNKTVQASSHFRWGNIQVYAWTHRTKYTAGQYW